MLTGARIMHATLKYGIVVAVDDTTLEDKSFAVRFDGGGVRRYNADGIRQMSLSLGAHTCTPQRSSCSDNPPTECTKCVAIANSFCSALAERCAKAPEMGALACWLSSSASTGSGTAREASDAQQCARKLEHTRSLCS